jgi:16S rRNA (guanine527-N7)-methyltransferase
VEHRAAGRAGEPAKVGPEWLAERLAGPGRVLGVSLAAEAVTTLARYAELVLDWGRRINLTGARSAAALADEHLADALPLLAELPPGPFRFVDVGSGVGLPGIVLAVLRPDATGVLLEPSRKKHAFLAHAIRELGLGDRLSASAERLEAHLAAGGRAAYDVAISRAAWPAAEWLDLGLALVHPGGSVIGVEGAEPGDLPPGSERQPYVIAGRRRAVVVRRP